MKKSIIFAVVAVAVISVSCRKERTCTCNWSQTYTETAGGSTNVSASTGTEILTMSKIKKRDAKVWGGCLDRTDKDTYSVSGYYEETVTVYTCELD